MVCTIRDQIKFKGKSVNINPKSIKELLSEDQMKNTGTHFYLIVKHFHSN